jgi:hypothetical protein
MLPLKRQGAHLVARRADGTVKAHVRAQKTDQRPQTWRRALSKLTNEGNDMLECLYALMHGNAYTPKVYDRFGKEDLTKECEVIIPTAEVRRAAAMNLHEMLRGKAVAETEVIASEREAEKAKQLESMSDAQLQSYIDGEYKMMEPGESHPAEGHERDATQEVVDADGSTGTGD